MPDWSYQPLFRPLLFCLPPERARDFTLGAVGQLARLPLGPGLIELMGHMRPPETLRRSVAGLEVPAPVGLGPGLDLRFAGLPALARFGFGFLEAGPVTASPVQSRGGIRRRRSAGAIQYLDLPVNDGLAALTRRLVRMPPLPVPVGFRLAHRPGAGAGEAAAERLGMIAALRARAAFFTLETRWGAADGGWSLPEWKEHLAAMIRATAGLPLWLALAPDLDGETVDRLVTPALFRGVTGVVVDGHIAGSGGVRLEGAPAREPGLRLVQHLRARWGRQLAVVANAGIQEPADALRLLEAGADLVQIHSGLVYGGPGLPKRINEALHCFDTGAGQEPAVPAGGAAAPETAPTAATAGWRRLIRWRRLIGWRSILVLGLSIALGGLLTGAIAAARAPLTAHGQLTLAGAMISTGLLYAMLALYPLRQGSRWAWTTLLVSTTIGFSGQFLAVAVASFDPLPALVNALLLPLVLLGLWRRPAHTADRLIPSLTNDWRWRAGQWGQFLFVVTGAGLTGAGLVMARDQAGLGGALAADGLALLLTTLWGFRRGAQWLWWTLLGAGAAGLAAGLGVHLAVNRTGGWHLAPAYAAAALYVLGLACAGPYLLDSRPAQRPGTET